MEQVKTILKNIRDMFAFSFAWLTICALVLAQLGGAQSIRVDLLMKLMALCLWGALCFALCFRSEKMQKKGFMFSLSVFYLSFLPVEILLFYLMGLFQHKGSLAVWCGFIAIISALYLISLGLERVFFKRKADLYTEKLCQFQKSFRDREEKVER